MSGTDLLAVLILVLMLLLCVNKTHAATPEFNTQNCVRSIIGEASDQYYNGMLAIACGIRNKGSLVGVNGFNAKHIDSEPGSTWINASLAWIESEKNRIHSGTYWGSKIVDKKWIEKMERNCFVKVYEFKDHVFYKEGV